jgi:general secretion pathway protein A
MYNTFFDFSEKPFKLVPNPEFLFLGKSHEEALAHLTYATSQGDGFVEITGEVGTGKTTLCRVFLEDLGKDIEAAFIFNSKLDSTQLIKAINSELGIVCSALDPADLTLALNEFLLKKKARGKSVILLIDEAQNLGQETLEQLRLLSNLETTRSKLLQIILVGQPELEEILDSYELRQLRQRINLSCHIHPLSLEETRDYMDHRVNVASRKPRSLFTNAAQKGIYEYSQGIPRLINIVCDRSLLVAYSLDQKKITPATVQLALRELAPRKYINTRDEFFSKKFAWAFFLILFAAILFLAVFNRIPLKLIPDIKPDNNIAKTSSGSPEEPVKSSDPEVVQIPSELENSGPVETETFLLPLIGKAEAKKMFANIHNISTRANVVSQVVSLWDHQSLIQIDPLTKQIDSDSNFFKIAAAQNNFQMLHLTGKINLIKKYNLPAILDFDLADENINGYIAVVEITRNNEYVITPGKGHGKVRISHKDLLPFLTGNVYILWKNNFGYNRVVSMHSSKASIITLKMVLRQIGFSSVDLTPEYNSEVREAVKQIQKKYGMAEDGVVGPLTKIMLYSEKREDFVPYLDQSSFNKRILPSYKEK